MNENKIDLSYIQLTGFEHVSSQGGLFPMKGLTGHTAATMAVATMFS